MSSIHIGMSGWTYEGWRGNFYPDSLKQKDELSFASRQVSAIEVNGTFYSLFRPSSYLTWYEQTPADFIFSVKGPKYITHVRRLKDFQTPLSNFLASGILALGQKLGPILWQFPPKMKFDPELFEPFLAALPHDMQTAATLGKGHSSWLDGRTYLEVAENHRMRHAIEGRHESFLSPEFVALARKYKVAIVIGDTAGRWPYIEDVTTDFLYLRLHADEIKYPRGYTKAALEHWAARLMAWASGSQPADAVLVTSGQPQVKPRSVYAYFDNDTKETAPLNAVSMISHLTQLGVTQPRVLEIAAAKKQPATATGLKKRIKAPPPKKQVATSKKVARTPAKVERKPASKKSRSVPKRTPRSA